VTSATRAGHSLVVHVHQLYNACAAMGEGSSDFGAIIKVFEAWARMEVKGT
jgi:3-hydroxyisobutyrate dehydrogenase-like beta-hydroxyacid dehydrogenase